MLPILRTGDVLYRKKINFHKININDLIMAKKNGKMFTHRVIYRIPSPGRSTAHTFQVFSGYLITKGDNNPQSDGKVYPKQVIGKVHKIKRNGQVFNPQDVNLLQSTLYFQEIIQVKKLFEKARINFVFLKGLPIHLYFEGRHPNRIYADCDLLVDVHDYGKTEAVFHRLGYSKAKTEYSSIHKILKDKQTEFSFYKKINDFPIVFDVHFEPVFLMNQLGKLNELYPQSLIDEMTEEFLRTKKEVTVQGEKFLILNTYYLILYLALHFFHHNFRGIHRLEMIDKVIRKALPVSFTPGESLYAGCPRGVALADKIAEYRLQNFVYPAFVLLKKYYDTPLPRGFLSLIEPREDKLRYTKKNIMKINVFDDETRIQAGINRFKNIFFLSPEPIYKKILVFLNPAVVYSILWVDYRYIRKKIRR